MVFLSKSFKKKSMKKIFSTKPEQNPFYVLRQHSSIQFVVTPRQAALITSA